MDDFTKTLRFQKNRVVSVYDDFSTIKKISISEPNGMLEMKFKDWPIWTGEAGWRSASIPVISRKNSLQATLEEVDFSSEVILLAVDTTIELIPVLMENSFQNFIIPKVMAVESVQNAHWKIG
jgi:hypothetical protein